MDLDAALIEAMFARHRVSGPWMGLPSTGLANRIFATPDVVLRVATDHPDGVVDARTESVAAPVVRAAGILTPRLIAFDDTRTLVQRPFSLWERVHGETLGLTSLTPGQTGDVWRAVGRELARLHLRVRECADPDGYLDEPARDQEVASALRRLVDAKKLDVQAARRVERLTEELRPSIEERLETRFIHDDIHPMNIMCSADGELLAIIDWGDAGCGDPTLDFAAIPFDAIRPALEGYETEAPGCLGASPAVRVAWNKLLDAVADLGERPDTPLDVEKFRRFVQSSMS
jgi:aminoglycoside phosphotransferase (APT) family kinase protein